MHIQHSVLMKRLNHQHLLCMSYLLFLFICFVALIFLFVFVVDVPRCAYAKGVMFCDVLMLQAKLDAMRGGSLGCAVVWLVV